jgi:hypothetical protein
MVDHGLSIKEERFAQALVGGATTLLEAGTAAGYACPQSEATVVIRRPSVQARVHGIYAERAFTAREILTEAMGLLGRTVKHPPDGLEWREKVAGSAAAAIAATKVLSDVPSEMLDDRGACCATPHTAEVKVRTYLHGLETALSLVVRECSVRERAICQPLAPQDDVSPHQCIERIEAHALKVRKWLNARKLAALKGNPSDRER